MTDEGPWEISAKTLTYRHKEKIYIAEGDVVITKNGQFLQAQKVTYDVDSGDVEALGDIRLKSGDDILTGERGSFNLKTKAGRMDNGRLFLSGNNYYLSGEIIEKLNGDTYRLKGCKLTTCDGDSPAWSITGSEVEVTIEGYGKIKHAAFRVRDVPLLYFPYMIFSAKTKRQTGLLLPRLGYSGRNGVDIEVPFFWAISDQTDATFYQRYISKRGYMQGLEFRYLADEDSKGDFLFDILSDRKDKKDMNNIEEVEISPYERTNSTRYWFRSRVDQDLPFGLVARLDGDLVSDQDCLREFEGGLFGFEARPDLAEEFGRPFEEKRSPTRRSAFRLSRDTENYSLQAGSSYNQRPENPSVDQTSQPLGSLDFVLLPEKLMNLPIYFNLKSSYDYVWRDEGEKGHQVSISPELRFPLWLFDRYLEFEPRISYLFNSEWIDNPEQDDNHLYKGAYEAGARLAASAERIYDVGWMNATKLKHKISPVLSYAYEIRQDNEDYRPWFEPIDRNIPIDKIRNLICLSLENFFDARLVNEKGAVSYRQWATFNLRQAYDIDEARRDENPEIEKKPLAPLTASLSIYPTSDLDLRWSTAWDHYEKEISYTVLSLDLTVDRSGGREDTYEVDYVNYKYGQESLNFWIDVNLAYGFSVGSSLERDLDLSENISNRYWLQYKSQCWGVKLIGEREDEETSIMLQFHLLGLGDFRAF
ncbi:MAG: LPS assembly protein LptD [Deltaproteobacteria bacterium]|nr:LPS assembly protein LptD [Deltaproteobacteria bacterium]